MRFHHLTLVCLMLPSLSGACGDISKPPRPPTPPAPRPPAPPPRPRTVIVSGLGIPFVTVDDDKDDDSFLSVEIPGARAWVQTEKEVFPDQSTTTKTRVPDPAGLDRLS